MDLEIINSSVATPSKDGERRLASGDRMQMRMWSEGPRGDKEVHASGYETVGYVLRGEALLTVGGKTTELKEGDSWCVPKGVEHKYTIKTEFEAIEAISPATKM